jgi:hypothetical protein
MAQSDLVNQPHVKDQAQLVSDVLYHLYMSETKAQSCFAA